jgi:peptidyl-prolyl cis-trans isomerase D
MATIGKIRKHSTLLLIMVGGALALFVLSDFLGSKGGGGRQKQVELAIVGSEKIHANDFYLKLDEQLEMYKMQYGDNLDGNMVFQIREEVFNELIRQTILKEQYEKIGLIVSQAEMVDMMTGVNIHPIIKQNFVDPQTGQFNPSAVTNYLLNLDSMEPQQQKQWFTLEKIMKNERYFEKYQNLIKKAYFIPKAMAASIYKKQGAMASAKIVTIKYSSIPDEEITLSDEDFSKYYENHKHEYEQEESRWLEYVIFDVLPSEQDIIDGQVVVNKLFEEFVLIPVENTQENYTFVNLKSDLDFNPDTNYMSRVLLPAQADTLFNLPVGGIVGPYSENNSYFMMKLLEKTTRADSLKASHILIAFKGAFRADPETKLNKEEAELKADSLLAVIKGKDSTFFAQTALAFSTDQSVQTNGGNLDWFQDGQMVTEFNEACQNAKVGEYFVVESTFGFHVIHLTGKKAFEPKVKVAMLKYTIEASSETTQRIFTEASKFAGENQTYESFNKAIEENGYVLRTSEYTRNSDYSIPGVMEGREIVRWSFDEKVENGTVSPVFELIGENKNVVVLARLVRKKGIAPLDEIKDMIEPLVRREKKADMLYDKMNQAKTGSNALEDIAKKLNAELLQIDFISLASPNLPQIGPEPKVVGTVFGTEKGKISRIVRGDAGIYLVQSIEITEAPATDDYTSIVQNQAGVFQNRANFDVYNALLKKADVKDNKVKFY